MKFSQRHCSMKKRYVISIALLPKQSMIHAARIIFRALADDEQSHIDFLHYSLEQLKKNEAIDIDRLVSQFPP